MLGFGWWEMVDGESPRCPGVNHEHPKKAVWSSDLAFGLPFQDARRPSMKNSASVTGTHGKRPVHLSRGSFRRVGAAESKSILQFPAPDDRCSSTGSCVSWEFTC